MKKVLKFAAQFILLWIGILLGCVLMYHMIIRHVIKAYEEGGYTSAIIVIGCIVVVYTIFWLLIEGFMKLVEFATKD